MGRAALERMAVDAVDLSARRQQFVQIAILTLGNAGTATDGFDEMFTEAAQHASDNMGFADSLTPDLVDANFVPGQIAEAALGPTARDYDAFAGAGTSILGDVAAGASGTPATSAPAKPLSKQQQQAALEIVTFPAWKDPYGFAYFGGSLSGTGGGS
jgi:hypothetical protein